MTNTEQSIRRSWETIKHLTDVQRLRQHENKVLIILTLTIGAVVGLVVVAFILLTENLGSRMYPEGGAAWRRLVVPVLGSLIAGFLLKRYFPGARGSGIPQTKTALFVEGGMIPLRTTLGKFACSSISLASGIALGREGPSVQVGAGIASTLGRRLGLSPSRVRALVPIGSSAALAAAFNTPIAAVLFTLEEVLGDLHARVLGAIVLSSATSWMVLRLLLGDEPLFHVPSYQLVHPLELVIYGVLGLVGGIVSVCFVRLLLWLRHHFLRMPEWTEALQPVAGGLLVGILGWFVPDVLGVGYNHVSQALNNQLALGTMAVLVVLKVVATAGCYASGNAGGIFGPSLFIGAMIGGAIGGGAHMILPDYTGSIGAYALVGMGTAFAGIIRVPLTSVIMIFEVTRDYSIIVPLMISNLISYFISSRLQRVPIYEALQHQDGIHLPAGAAQDRDELISVSEGAHYPKEILSASDQVGSAHAKAGSSDAAWPVVGPSGFLGMVTSAQLADAVQQGRGSERIADLLPSIDPRNEPDIVNFPHIHADQSLDHALRRMAQTGLNVLPVVSRTNLRKLIGILSLNDALAAYRSASHEKIQTDETPETQPRVALLRGVLAVLIVIIALSGFLIYTYQSQRVSRAEENFEAGNRLMEAGQYQQAIEQYRSALSISHSGRDRLALGEALLRAGRLNEAGIYLREYIRDNPNSGPANLGIARIASQEGRLQEAVDYYRRAIYDPWPENALHERTQARIELAETLGKSGQEAQAQAELLSLKAEMPEDSAIRKRVGEMLLDFKLPEESAEVFQAIVEKSPKDAEAYACLGEAEFALDNYRKAEEAFKSALLWNPDDAASMRNLSMVEQILALDPTLRGLKRSDRYARSRDLMKAVLSSLDQCLAISMGPHRASVFELSETARKSLERRRAPRSYSDATETNLELIEQLWNARIDACGPPTEADEVLTRVIAQLSK